MIVDSYYTQQVVPVFSGPRSLHDRRQLLHSVGSTCFFRPSVAVLYHMKNYGRHQTSVDFYVPPVLYRSRCISFAIQCSKSSNATLFFFCALYTPHHICKSFPTYHDHHVNCPLLSVDVRIMLMSSVEQPARRMGSLCCSQDV